MIIPKGKVGLLSGTWGSGKGLALVQLAIAVATGGEWFGRLQANKGKVLLASAVDDSDDILRRMQYACDLLKLSDEEINDVESNVMMAPTGPGLPSFFLTAEGERTELLEGIREAVECHKIALVILDPWSRFYGHNHNHDKTINELHSIAMLPCRPSVIVAHSEPIEEGFHWKAHLHNEGEDRVRLINTKMHPEDGQPFRDILLSRIDSHEGALSPVEMRVA